MTNLEACKWLTNLKNDIGNPHYECLWGYEQALDEIIDGLENGTLLKEQPEVAQDNYESTMNEFMQNEMICDEGHEYLYGCKENG